MPNDTSEPIMQDELPRIARAARAKVGITQDEAAERLSVSKPSISRAENRPGGRYLNLQRRMIEELAGWQIEGPLWKLTKRVEDHG